MKDWLTIPEAAAQSERTEDEIRRAIVMGELRAEPTGDLSTYMVDADDLARFAGLRVAPAPSRRPRLLPIVLALGVIGAGLMVVAGLSGRCCVSRCGNSREVPADLKAYSDEQLLRLESVAVSNVEASRKAGAADKLAKAEKSLESIRAEKARRAH